MLIILIADVDVNASCDAEGRSTIDGDCAAMFRSESSTALVLGKSDWI